jgi:hypothetical protein
MQLTLLESGPQRFRSIGMRCLSIVAHLAIVWAAMASTNGSFRLPTSGGTRAHVPPPARPGPRRRAHDGDPHVGKLASGAQEPRFRSRRGDAAGPPPRLTPAERRAQRHRGRIFQ